MPFYKNIFTIADSNGQCMAQFFLTAEIPRTHGSEFESLGLKCKKRLQKLVSATRGANNPFCVQSQLASRPKFVKQSMSKASIQSVVRAIHTFSTSISTLIKGVAQTTNETRHNRNDAELFGATK